MRFLPLWLMTMISFPAFAIVDVHEEYFSNLGEPAFSTFSFELDGARGTKQENEFNIENHSLLRQGTSTWMFIGAYNFAETNDEKNEDNQFAHIRYVRRLEGRHGFDVLAQFQQDEFARIDSRILFGGGYRYEWTRDEDYRGLFGIGAIRERERYVAGGEQELWRANLYFSVGQPVSFIPDSALTLSAYAQPALESADDIRAIVVASLTTRLTPNLGIDFGVDVAYDSDPEPGFDSTELEFSVGIEWTFK